MSNVVIDRNKIDLLANSISVKSGEQIPMTLDKMIESVDGINTDGITPTGTSTLTANGTFNVRNYEYAYVNVISPWTKIAEKEATITYSSTSVSTHETWETGHPEIWTSDKIVFVRIRDKVGKRPGYFYGSDTFLYNYHPVNSDSETSMGVGMTRNTIAYNNSSIFTLNTFTGTTGYGIFADYFYSDGSIRIRKRYTNTISFTIDSTYKIEVWTLNPAGGMSLFV